MINLKLTAHGADNWCRHIVVAACMVGALAGNPAQALPDCNAGPGIWDDFRALPRTTAALGLDHRLKVVAIGSSSTEGVGASTPGHAYPAQLARLLRRRFPDSMIEVINRGVGGERVADNLVRLERDVIQLDPDLVIWQVGTNDALRDVPAAELQEGLLRGIERLRATGADIVLIGPQLLPKPEWNAAAQRVLPVLRDAASSTHTPLLARHRLMADWLRSGHFTLATLLVADGLHMTDDSYRCLAERIGDLFPRPADASSTLAALDDVGADPRR